tara:strand:+ start:1401 stop:1796 length:396 start_codon:yes stop_codon:yes gene_type:complete
MAVVTLLSDFVDGTSMALSEDTDAKNLNSYMVRNPGQLWAGMQQRRLARKLTRKRRGPGTLYFAPTETAQACVSAYLQSDTGSDEEKTQHLAMQASGVEIAPHVGEATERNVLFSRQQRSLSKQAQAKGFG